MWKWRNEVLLNSRYAAAGIVNSAVGLATIWGLTSLGAHPVIANFLGYAAGLSIGFLGARTYVFRSKGHLTPEAVRYLVTFFLCYVINLATLHACLSFYAMDPLPSQGLAVSSYAVSMYLCARFFVFSRKSGKN